MRVFAGSRHSCALAPDGIAWCWGDGSDGRLALSGTSGVVELGLGSDHSCALLGDGTVHCVGAIDAPPATLRASRLSSGAHSACVIQGDHQIACWGGDLPQPPADLTAAAIAIGADHACAITLSGEVRCWGADTHGESSPPAFEPPGKPASIAAGLHQTCVGLEDGRVRCWGLNSDLTAQFPGRQVRSLSLGIDGAICVVAATGGAGCLDAKLEPMAGGPASGIAAIAVGDKHACAILDHPNVSCWGANEAGQTAVPPILNAGAYNP